MKEQLKAILQWIIAFILAHKTNTAIAIVSFILGALIF